MHLLCPLRIKYSFLRPTEMIPSQKKKTTKAFESTHQSDPILTALGTVALIPGWALGYAASRALHKERFEVHEHDLPAPPPTQQQEDPEKIFFDINAKGAHDDMTGRCRG